MPLHNDDTIPPCLPPLATGEIHIWQRVLSSSQDHLRPLNALLSEEERQRAQRFHSDQDRSAFIIARGTLRILLGHYVNRPPARLRFVCNPQGKPGLEGLHHAVFFNLSHARHRGMYAITREAPVGVDLERVRPAPPQARLHLARRFFSHAEYAQLKALPTSQLDVAFCACWTRKEAYVKCHGLSIARLLSKFSVSVHPEEPATLLATPWRPEDMSLHRLYDVPSPSGYRAALAIAAPHAVTFRHFSWGEQA